MVIFKAASAAARSESSEIAGCASKRQPWAGGWLCVAGGVLLLSAGLAAARLKQIPFSLFTRDVLEIADLPYYVGALSSVGWMLWAFTAAICVFTGLLLRRFEEGPFFLAAGAISSLLLADDVFLLHEIVVPQYLKVSETIVYGGYALILLSFSFVFRRRLIQSRWDVLLAGCLFAAASMVVDKLPGYLSFAHHILEDGAKLLAIAAWCGYFTTLAWQHAAGRLGSSATTARARKGDRHVTVAKRDENENIG